MLQFLVVNRLIDPGSEFRVHRHWFDQRAMDLLLGVVCGGGEGPAVSLPGPHLSTGRSCSGICKRAGRPCSLTLDVLLYDLTSTYFEGEAELIRRPGTAIAATGGDCRQVVVALIVTPEGLPLAYEVLPGNTFQDDAAGVPEKDRIALRQGPPRLADGWWDPQRSRSGGRAHSRREISTWWDASRGVSKYEKRGRPAVAQGARLRGVKLFGQDAELYVLAKSDRRQAKETPCGASLGHWLLWKLRAMRRSCPKRDQLLMRVGAAKTEAGRAFGYVKIHLPEARQTVTPETFTFQVDKAKLREAQLRDGHDPLCDDLVAEDPAVLWDRYMQLVQVEAAFKCLKSDLGIRPIYHQLEHRVEAHILIAFLAYCLTATLKHRLQEHTLPA